MVVPVFLPAYLTRALLLAKSEGCGLAFMHSHPAVGWQDMSEPDIVAERDVLAPPSRVTGLPLVGLTVGSDGYWSARFWIKSNGFQRHWCTKVRVVGKDKYSLFYNDELLPPPPRRAMLRRTYDTWGAEAQSVISRLHVGVVGVGSVGSVVTEALARIGVPVVTLVDPDVVKEHNLDRLLNATHNDVGRPKVELAKMAFVSHATTASPKVHALSKSIHTVNAYRAILDCDLIFSCVDRPIARDVLNYVSQGHLVPVLDGGIAVGVQPSNRRLSSAHWRCHVSTPLHACLRCRDQYNTSMVVLELDGSLDDPSYTRGLDEDLSARNEKCLSVHALPGEHARQSLPPLHHLRYLVAEAGGRAARAAVHSQHPRLNRPRGLRRTLRVPRYASDRGCRGTAVPVASGVRIPGRALDVGSSLSHPYLPRYLISENVTVVPEMLFLHKSSSIVFLTFSGCGTVGPRITCDFKPSICLLYNDS